MARAVKPQRGSAFTDLALVLLIVVVAATAYPNIGLTGMGEKIRATDAVTTVFSPMIVTHYSNPDGSLGAQAIAPFFASSGKASQMIHDNGYPSDFAFWGCSRIGGSVTCNFDDGSTYASGIGTPNFDCEALIASKPSSGPGPQPWYCVQFDNGQIFAAPSSTIPRAFPTIV